MAQEFISRKRFEEIKEELDYLVTVKRSEIGVAIQKARAFGDLSENSEYDEARDQQAKVEARIAELEYLMKNASSDKVKAYLLNQLLDEAQLQVKKIMTAPDGSPDRQRQLRAQCVPCQRLMLLCPGIQWRIPELCRKKSDISGAIYAE